MADIPKAAKRPLSPHLQIYKPMLTMMMSIAHRITGVALYLGTLLLAWWLIAAATNEAYFTFVNELAGSVYGRLVLFGFSWALFHHMLGGIRHFIWDTGRGFDLNTVEWMARFTLVGGLAITLGVWYLAYKMMGVL
ncbi:MAG: succinate dehydrogenase, cytochrome b556 subunit [Methyloligellaceae bacterium]